MVYGMLDALDIQDDCIENIKIWNRELKQFNSRSIDSFEYFISRNKKNNKY
jgi:hypothetical protein